MLLTGSLLVALAVVAVPASATSYKATVSGQQELTWSMDGTRGGCEIRRGAGSGRAFFRFRSPRSEPATALARGRGLYFGMSNNATATGTIAGSFTDSLSTACSGFEPAPTYVEPAEGCGDMKFGVRVDASAHGAFLYVTGPNWPISGSPGSTAANGDPCPFLSSLSNTDFSTCGDGNKLWLRSWAFGALGQGLAASKIAVKRRALLKPKRRKFSLTGRTKVDCTMPSSYTGGIKITLDLRYTITLKKTR